jgi:hypothetical protein
MASMIFGTSLDHDMSVLVNVRTAGEPNRGEIPRPVQAQSNFIYLGGINMTKIRNIVTSGVLVLSLATISYGGTITGSRTGASGSRVGTITGSRTGTITGSRVGTITGSGTESPRSVLGADFLFRLMSLVLNSGW